MLICFLNSYQFNSLNSFFTQIYKYINTYTNYDKTFQKFYYMHKLSKILQNIC